MVLHPEGEGEEEAPTRSQEKEETLVAWSAKARAAAAAARRKSAKYRKQNLRAKLSHVRQKQREASYNASIGKIGKLRSTGGHAAAAKRYAKQAAKIKKQLGRTPKNSWGGPVGVRGKLARGATSAGRIPNIGGGRRGRG